MSQDYKLDSIRLHETILHKLSELFRLFKSQLIGMEKILTHNRNNLAYQQQGERNNLKDIVRDEHLILEELKPERKYLTIFNMTFHRFFSRLIQIIEAYSVRIKNKQYQKLSEYYDSIFLVINHAISSQFTDHFQSLSSICQMGKQYTIKILQQLSKNSILPQNLQQQTILSQIIFQSSLSPSKNSSPSKTKTQIISSIPHKYQIKLNQMLKTLSILNIDGGYYKSGFYSARHNSNQLFQEIHQRNFLIDQQILQYKTSYAFYKLRKNKQRRVNRKNCSQLSSLGKRISMKLVSNQMLVTSDAIQSPQKSIQKQIKQKRNIKYRKMKTTYQNNQTKNNLFKTSQSIFLEKKFKPPHDSCLKNRNGTFNNTYFANKAHYQPKKVLLNGKKLSLRPLDFQQKQNFQSNKKKSSISNNQRRRNDQSLDVGISGRKINQAQTKKYLRKSPVQKNYHYNHLIFS